MLSRLIKVPGDFVPPVLGTMIAGHTIVPVFSLVPGANSSLEINGRVCAEPFFKQSWYTLFFYLQLVVLYSFA
jgi:hypothetical protein